MGVCEGRVTVESTLSDVPCLCHSDVKLTDVFVQSTASGHEYILIDFDNVFAFVPEFDLCKLHFSALEHGLNWDLSWFAGVAATAYGASESEVARGMRSVYPLVLYRLLGWAVKRRHRHLIALIQRVSQAIFRRS